MQYPKLNELPTNRQIVDTFRGYNHNLRISDGEFFDMKNMTSDHYPILAPRGRRFIPDNGNSHGNYAMISKDVLCYVSGPYFHISGENSTTVIDMHLNDEPKRLISMGSYVIIMPDKRYVNINDMEHGSIEAYYSSGTNQVTFTPCSITGESYGDATVSATAPVTAKDKDLWIDTSGDTKVLKRYSEASGMWASVATTYVKIEAANIGEQFKQYDGVTISCLEGELSSMNGSTVLWGVGNDYLIVTGLLDKTHTTFGSLSSGAPSTGGSGTGEVTPGIVIERKMPNMDFIIESENRLWGCRCGEAVNGEWVNEIYASKLGDFRNWNCFQGLSTDSYVASCGTDGPFTGAITHLGYPLFFKENCVHKVYGNYPANFQIQTTACRGVQRGSHGSLAIVNETLFYKARSGVCAYDGSLPVEVSYALGGDKYSDAVAGSHGNKYYISMKDNADQWHLFVYDVGKGMWHKEDNFRADDFCSHRDELLAVEHDTGKIVSLICPVIPKSKTDPMQTGKAPNEDKVKWMVQTGPLGTDMPDMKYISRLIVRMSMDLGTRVRFLVQYDSMGGWEHLCSMTGTNLRSFSIPIRPRRCDHLRLRIEGEGDARIYSITKTIEQGSDIS